MPKKRFTTPQAPAPIGPYSQAIAAGGLLFVSGQIALDPETDELVAGGIEKETERVLKNLMGILTAAGLGPEAVVRTTVFMKDLAEFPRMNEVYARFFPKEPPARSTVQVAALPKGVSVEIDLIAAF